MPRACLRQFLAIVRAIKNFRSGSAVKEDDSAQTAMCSRICRVKMPILSKGSYRLARFALVTIALALTLVALILVAESSVPVDAREYRSSVTVLVNERRPDPARADGFPRTYSIVAQPNLVPYPEGYRDWAHVKTVLVSERHPDFARSGGFRHIYANPQAAKGYRGGVFPDGSIIVVDWLEGKDDNGMHIESTRRRLDVMVKDQTRFTATGGWGWERFKGDSRTERIVTSPASECMACHTGPGTRDLVFSRFRE